MDRINNEILNKDIFYEEIQNLNNEKTEILSNMIYDGYSYKIQFNDINNFNNTENIVKNLPYVDYSKCKNQYSELSSDSDNKIIGINLFANVNSTNFNDVSTKFMNENGELIEDICDSYVVKFPVDKNEVNLTNYLEIMDEYGYDIMDPENKFFNDLCTPFNHINNWIAQDINYYQSFGIKIILRSIFYQGLRITPPHKRVRDFELPSCLRCSCNSYLPASTNVLTGYSANATTRVAWTHNVGNKAALKASALIE